MTERWGGEPTEPMPGSGGYGRYGDDPTRLQPPGSRPTGPGGPDDRRRRRNRNWVIAGGVVAAVIIVVLVVLLVTSGGNSNAVTVSSFNVPSTVRCSGPTTIGVSWTTTNATQVVLSIDGSAPYKTYPGGSGADSVPFACNGADHTYTITAKSSTGAQATDSRSVSQISTGTTTTRPTTTTTTPPTTSAPTTSSSTTTTTT